ncbi:hypothetical protein [Mycoplasmopsis fermentans]|uniref:Lipoprotein n=2 Tax=Mycoplasmopsis fermentans TaxID=2115 RepID=A0AB32XD27_MYCFM|nr:hypothetical protein [Mycoplasmopsis fermentans]ADV34961.1 Hypothetical Protein MfeM64YM_0966 [Mycoplasmopsis fermentans M64]
MKNKKRKLFLILSSLSTLPFAFVAGSCVGKDNGGTTGKPTSEETKADLNKLAKNIVFDVKNKQDKFAKDIKNISNLVVSNLDLNKYELIHWRIEAQETSIKIYFKIKNSANLVSDENTYEITGFKKSATTSNPGKVPANNPSESLLKEVKKVKIDYYNPALKKDVLVDKTEASDFVATGFNEDLFEININYDNKLVDTATGDLYISFKLREKANNISVDGYCKVQGFKPFDSVKNPDLIDVANAAKAVNVAYEDKGSFSIYEYNANLVKFENYDSSIYDLSLESWTLNIYNVSTVIISWSFWNKNTNSLIKKVTVIDGFKPALYNKKSQNLSVTPSGVFATMPTTQKRPTFRISKELDAIFDKAKEFYLKPENFDIYTGEFKTQVYGKYSSWLINDLTKSALESLAKKDLSNPITTLNSWNILERAFIYNKTKFVVTDYTINGDKVELKFKLCRNLDDKSKKSFYEISTKEFTKEITLATEKTTEKAYLDKLIDNYDFSLPEGLQQYHAHKVLSQLKQKQIGFFEQKKWKNAIAELKKEWPDLKSENVYLNIIDYRQKDVNSFEADVTFSYQKDGSNKNQRVISKVRTLQFNNFKDLNPLIKLVDRLNKSMVAYINPNESLDTFNESLGRQLKSWMNGSNLFYTVSNKFKAIDFTDQSALNEIQSYYDNEWDINAYDSGGSLGNYAKLAPNCKFETYYDSSNNFNLNTRIIFEDLELYEPDYNHFDLEAIKLTHNSINSPKTFDPKINNSFPFTDSKLEEYVKTDDFKHNLEANIKENFYLLDFIKKETSDNKKDISKFVLSDLELQKEYDSILLDEESKKIIVTNIENYLNNKFDSKFNKFLNSYFKQAEIARKNKAIKDDQKLFRYTIKEFSNIDAYQSKIKIQVEIFKIEAKAWKVVDEFEFVYQHDSEIRENHCPSLSTKSTELKDATIGISQEIQTQFINLMSAYGVEQAMSSKADKLEFLEKLMSVGGAKIKEHDSAISFINAYLFKMLIFENVKVYERLNRFDKVEFTYDQVNNKVVVKLVFGYETHVFNIDSNKFDKKVLNVIKVFANNELNKFIDEIIKNNCIKLKDNKYYDENLHDRDLEKVFEIDYTKTTDKGNRFKVRIISHSLNNLQISVIDTKMREMYGYSLPYVTDGINLDFDIDKFLSPVASQLKGIWAEIENFTVAQQKELFALIKDKTDFYSIDSHEKLNELIVKIKSFIKFKNVEIESNPHLKQQVLDNLVLIDAVRKTYDEYEVIFRIKGKNQKLVISFQNK